MFFAGSNVNIAFEATDPNPGDVITITATGAIFNIGSNPATFNGNSTADTVVGFFNWNPDCNDASNSYQKYYHSCC